MDIDVKKKGLQSLMKALALMPEGKEEVCEGEMPKMAEAEESVADEMAESPAEQAEEKLAGEEKHPVLAAKVMEVKKAPSVMEKLSLDDLSLEELQQIKEKLKSMGLV